MSTKASDLIELSREPRSEMIEQTLRRLALNLIAPGVADMRGGC